MRDCFLRVCWYLTDTIRPVMFLSEWITQRGACTEAGVRVRLAVSGLFSASKGAGGHEELSDLLTLGHSQVYFTGST